VDAAIRPILQSSTNRIANIPMTINIWEQNWTMSSEKMFFRSFVSPAIRLSRSPDFARLWKASDSRCRWVNSSRRTA
jgi:hypothetical protein